MRAGLFMIALVVAAPTARAEVVATPRTFCNPIDIDYRFMPVPPWRREAADPVMLRFHGEYYLFASKSGGYWRSPDMRSWTLVEPQGLPIEDYAPAVIALGDRLYYTAFNSRAMFESADPKGGRWTKVGDLPPFPDPALFRDDDGRLFVFHGCAQNGVITGALLDPKAAFKTVGAPFRCTSGDFARRGWERTGDDNLGRPEAGARRFDPWIEGPWVTKHAGKYYVQYAAPGTEYKSYADGAFVAERVEGPYAYAPWSPVAAKATGFITGAGHGALFEDAAGRPWRVVTMTISVLHKFERRLGIFPAGFDGDGVMYTETALGDFPQLLPGRRAPGARTNLAGFMLLSRAKPARASSTLDGYPLANAFDEEVRTSWSAATGNPGEWVTVDLGGPRRIEAIQLNFAEVDAKILAAGRRTGLAHRYRIEASLDGRAFTPVADRSASTRDAPHDYLELEPLTARFVRVTNVAQPAGARFGFRDLRIFGRADGPPPAAPGRPGAARYADDPTRMTVTWPAAPRAQGYVVRYGIARDKLYQSHQVWDATTATVNSINAGVRYFVVVDALNESGVTPGTETVEAQ